MAGIFKKLSANDIKITPFEAHKQYNTTDLASIGASTESINWSGYNKNTFPTASRLYYQIDKLYYRDYISERSHRLEIDSANYKVQERRLYGSASLISLSQTTFGSGIQPETFELSGSKLAGNRQFHFKDDGFGNLYDVNLGKDNFPDEKHRVLYLAPVKAFRRENKILDIDPNTGDPYVNNPFASGYSNTVYDDSYFQNEVTFVSMSFLQSSDAYQLPLMRHTGPADGNAKIIIKNQPYLNFNGDDEFAISFYIDADPVLTDFTKTDKGIVYILSKEGAETSLPLGSQVGGDYSTSTTGALDLTTTPASPAFPYRIYADYNGNAGYDVFFERFDGNIKATVSASFISGSGDQGLHHFVFQKTTGGIGIYKDGVKLRTNSDKTTTCQNNADLILYRRRLPDGSYSSENHATWGSSFQFTQFQIWDKALTLTEIQMISESFTGPYPVGNLFYDNGFAVVTHPKYMDIFSGTNTLNTLKYKNTHLITENEYQCIMNDNEFEFTTNKTILKTPLSNEIANFATGSTFKPYVTTVGLYNDTGDLLVVGKLGQPIKASSETDTTFVIRFDT